MAPLLLELVLSLLVAGVTIFVLAYLKALRARKLCNWMPHAPSLPIVGSIFEFHGHTETLQDLMRLTDNKEKMVYLDVVHISNIVSKNPEFVEFILSSNTLLDKSDNYQYLHSWLGTGLLTSTGSKWKMRRKVITPAFYFSILEQFVDTFDANANALVEQLRPELGKAGVDIDPYVKACTLDTICETAMGVKINAQNNENQDYVFAVKDICRILVNRMFSSWRGFEVLFRLTDDYRKQRNHLKILHGFTNSIIQRRMAELVEKKVNHNKPENDELGRKHKLAFLDLLLNSTVNGKPLTQEDIREEVDTFMFEGHDTTSSATSSALFLLANHSEVQKLARNEQKSIFGEDTSRMITHQDLQEMKYLEMVIKEALRLYPSVPLVARRVTEDTLYKDHIIPKGTLVSLFIYGLNRDPDFFENPNEFTPERFMNMVEKPGFSYVPFSAGPRNCIGKRFAMLEMKTILSRILQNFELLPTDPRHQLRMSNELVLKSLNGVRVQLRKCDWNAD